MVGEGPSISQGPVGQLKQSVHVGLEEFQVFLEEEGNSSNGLLVRIKNILSKRMILYYDSKVRGNSRKNGLDPNHGQL